MSNGDIMRKAEVDVILSGGRPEVDRFLVETVLELKHGQGHLHGLLKGHLVEAEVRDKKIAANQQWIEEWEASCPERMKKAVADGLSAAEDNHDVKHAAHMREHHPDPHRAGETGNHTAERRELAREEQKTLAELFMGYGIVKWALTIACGTAIIFGVNMIANRITVDPGHEKLEKAILEQNAKERELMKEEIIRQEQLELERFKQELLDAMTPKP